MSRSTAPLPMFIALLQFEIEIPGAESLKDKRRVVQSIKDRFHRDHQCSVAEVGNLENPSLADVAIAFVGADRKYLRSVLDVIEHKLTTLPEGRLGACERQILSAQDIQHGSLADPTPIWNDAELDAIEDQNDADNGSQEHAA
ncbi:MAG: DUF503 domain-containing protein [Phycisphaerales bacterium]